MEKRSSRQLNKKRIRTWWVTSCIFQNPCIQNLRPYKFLSCLDWHDFRHIHPLYNGVRQQSIWHGQSWTNKQVLIFIWNTEMVNIPQVYEMACNNNFVWINLLIFYFIFSLLTLFDKNNSYSFIHDKKIN